MARFSMSKADVKKLIHVKVESAGFNGGNLAQITVNDITTCLQKNENGHKRGLHIVVINPMTGHVEQARVFDTYQSSDLFDNFI